MERRPKPGEKYRHFKNKIYQIISVATHSETGEELVIYQALYGDFGVYARPLSMFVSEVDHVKYPDVTQKYRFELLENVGSEVQNTRTTQADNPGGNQENTVDEAENDEPQVAPALMEFLEADSCEEKYNILVSMKDIVTDSMIDTMAVVLDVVIPDGPIEKRYEDLKYTIRTRQQYEYANRLR